MLSVGILALICLAFCANLFLFLQVDIGNAPKPIRLLCLLPTAFMLAMVALGSAVRDPLFEIPAIIVLGLFVIFMSWTAWSAIELFRQEKDPS